MAERRRILLAEITPGIPQPRQYAVWNPADKTQYGTITDDLTFTGTSSVLRPPLPWSGVRATLPLAAGRYYWEVRLSLNLTNASPVAVGIYQYAGTPGQYLGEVPTTATTHHSLLLMRDGWLYHGGAQLAFVGALVDADVVRLLVDMDARTIALSINAGAWTEVAAADLDPAFFDTPIHPAVASNYEHGMVVNFGGNLASAPFAHAVPANCRAGVYLDPAAVPTTLYFSSETFGTGAFDTPAEKQYIARIGREPDVEIERRGGCWAWGGQSASRRGSLALVNADGALNALHEYVWRDAPITLLSGYAGDARGDFTTWTQATVDHLSQGDDGRIILALTDPLSLFDRPLQPALYADTAANAQIRGKPYPIVLGRPMYCEAVRLDTTPAVRDYDIHDGLQAAGSSVGRDITIAAIYDRGDVFDPIDWTYRSAGGAQVGFTLVNAPDGRIVCNPIGPKIAGVVVEDAAQMLAYVATRAWMAAGRSGSPPWGGSIGTALTAARMAYFASGSESALAVLRQIMDSLLGWVWAKRDGTYAAATMTDPAAAAPDIVLDTRNVVRVARRDDEAKGLTLRIGGRRNHSVHSDSDIAGSVPVDPVAVPFDLRQELKSALTIVRTADTLAAAPMTPVYGHATAAPAQPTLLQDAADIQLMANRVASLWRQPRQFFEVEALLGPSDADALEPGQIARLTWDRRGLSVDRNLLVIGVTSRFFSRRVPLLLWG